MIETYSKGYRVGLGQDAGGKTQQMDNITFLRYNHIFIGLHSLASLVAIDMASD